MILSIETATSTCSIAITRNDQVLAEQTYYIDKSHSALLPVIIEEMLRNVGVEKMALQAVAVSDGPGSYTGLRIGASVAKGFCYALDIPLIPISTIKSLAFTVQNVLTQEYLLCPMLDARRMEVYMAVYESGKLNELLPVSAVVLDQDTFEKYNDRKILLFGNGAEKTKEIYGEMSNIYYLDHIHLKASSIGLLAEKHLSESNFVDLAYYEPNYFKEFRAIKPKPIF